MSDRNIYIGAVILASLMCIPLAPMAMKNLNDMKAIGATQATAMQEAQKASVKAVVQEELREIAENRYRTGCELIVTLDDLGTASTIVEGQPIIAGAYAKANKGKPLSKINPSHFLGRNVVVCDSYGATAVMEFDPKRGYAVAGSLAVTNNRDLMAEILKQKPGIKRPSLVSK